jgi:hypothetical protein
MCLKSRHAICAHITAMHAVVGHVMVMDESVRHELETQLMFSYLSIRYAMESCVIIRHTREMHAMV